MYASDACSRLTGRQWLEIDADFLSCAYQEGWWRNQRRLAHLLRHALDRRSNVAHVQFRTNKSTRTVLCHRRIVFNQYRFPGILIHLRITWDRYTLGLIPSMEWPWRSIFAAPTNISAMINVAMRMYHTHKGAISGSMVTPTPSILDLRDQIVVV